MSAQLPEGIAAFHFNLYELVGAHAIEIVGCPTYDPNDSEWACDDIFMSDAPRFTLSYEEAGSHWEQGLASAIDLLATYLASGSAGAARMKESEAVSIGFVDGDLHLVWARDA
ncbi:hypothetical protein ACVNIS_06525 [Sphaerotilaceae bacterium SBD11-9]